MGHKTVVRIAEGTQLSSAMLKRLTKIFEYDLNSETDIDYYPTAPRLMRSYQRRMTSLLDAFQFVVKAIPGKIASAEIETYLAWCQDYCALSADNTLTGYQLTLTQYATFLVDALLDGWQWPAHFTTEQKKVASIELLNKAEQYVLMQQGRVNIATLCAIDIYDSHNFVLQWEKQLPPFSAETIDELKEIKKNKFTTTPDWFRNLPVYQQLFFYGSDPHEKTKALLKSNLTRLEDTWKNLKKLFPTTLLSDLAIIAQGDKPQPTWFSELSSAHQAVIRALAPTVRSLNDIDKQLTLLDGFLPKLTNGAVNSLVDLRKLPYWFLSLSAHEQQLLAQTLNDTTAIETIFAFLSSRHRTLPGVANFGEHYLLVLDDQGNVLTQFERRLRSSHVASREVKDLIPSIGELHCLRNLKLIKQKAGDKSIHYQTLISPLKLNNTINWLYDTIVPDRVLDEQLQKGIHVLEQTNQQAVYFTNHPFNFLKNIKPTYATDAGCLAILKAAEDRLLPSFIKKHHIAQDPNLDAALTEMVTFTCIYNKQKAFAQARQLARNSALLTNDYAKTLSQQQLKELVILASTDVNYNKQNITDSRLRAAPISDEEKLKQTLINLMEKQTDQSLFKCTRWPNIVANHWFLACHPKHAQSVQFIDKTCDLAQLTCEYRNLLNSGYLTGTVLDYYGRELWLSSLESLLIIHMDGVSHGSCVSGKDRKAIELIHTDAMLLYREKYGSWPSINDTDEARNNFVDLVATLYVTRHAHEHAGQNAKGADGIKTPTKYWPADIAAAINHKLGYDGLTIDNTLATNNEVKDIGNISYRVKENYANCLLAVLRLSPANRETLFNKVTIKVADKTLWGEANYGIAYGPPAGIGKMRAILDSGESSIVKKLADTYAIAYGRLSGYSVLNRSDNTQRLYNALIKLGNAEDPNVLVNEVLLALNEIKPAAGEMSTATMAM